MRTIELTEYLTLEIGPHAPGAFLPPERRLAWCEELLSGRHIQGEHFLWNKTEDTKCCLGVKYWLENTKHSDMVCPSISNPDDTVVVAFFDTNTTVYRGLDHKILDDLGQLPPGTYFSYEDEIIKSLAGLNDRGVPFSAIALAINAVWCSETWWPYYAPPICMLP